MAKKDEQERAWRQEMQREMDKNAKSGDPVWPWGGIRYFVSHHRGGEKARRGNSKARTRKQPQGVELFRTDSGAYTIRRDRAVRSNHPSNFRKTPLDILAGHVGMTESELIEHARGNHDRWGDWRPPAKPRRRGQRQQTKPPRKPRGGKGR